MNSRWICVIHRIYTPDWSQSHKISNDVGMSTSKFGTHPFPRRPFVLEPWMKRLPRSRLQLRTNAVTAISGSPPVPVFLDRSGCQIWGLYSYTKQFALWSHWWFARGILKSSEILHSGWWIIDYKYFNPDRKLTQEKPLGGLESWLEPRHGQGLMSSLNASLVPGELHELEKVMVSSMTCSEILTSWHHAVTHCVWSIRKVVLFDFASRF